MSKWMAVAALGAMMAVVGCDKNKDDDAGNPTMMSTSAKSADCSACPSGKKEAEPKKLSSAAPTAKADCQTQCPAGAAKAK